MAMGKRSAAVVPKTPGSDSAGRSIAGRARQGRFHLWFPFALAVIAYAPTLRYDFVWDDVTFIVDNPAGHRWSDLGEVLRHGYSWNPIDLPAKNDALYYYRPVVTGANLVGWVGSGGRPSLFHLQNMLAHACAAMLLALLASWLGLSTATALVIGSAFAIHPAISEGVVWISGRADIFAAAFVLAALTLLTGWLTGRLGRGLGTLTAFGLSVFLALGSKESAVVLVVLAPMLLVLMPAHNPPGQPGRADRSRRGAWIALFLPVVVYLLLRLLAVGTRTPEAYLKPTERLEFTSRLLLSGHLLLVYLQKCVLPVGLTSETPASLLRRPPALLPGLLGLLALAAGGLFWLHQVRAWVRRRERAGVSPAGALGLGLFLLALAPVLQWVPTGEIYGERFLYLPMAGLLLFLASLLDARLRRRPMRAWLLLGAAGIPLLVLLEMHLPIWKDELAFFGNMVRTHPNSARALANLGTAQVRLGRLQDAEDPLARAAQLDPADPEKEALYANVLLNLGRMEEGMRHLEQAHARGARSLAVLRNLGVSWTRVGRYDEAAEILRAALALAPREASLYEALATAERRRGRPEEAASLLRGALELKPARRSTWRSLVAALIEAGRPAEAEETARLFQERFPGESIGEAGTTSPVGTDGARRSPAPPEP